MSYNNIKSSYNFAKTNWKALKTKIKEYLLNINNFQLEEIIARKMNRLVKEITEVITKTIEKIISRKKINFFSKKWWNEKLIELYNETNKLRNRHIRTGKEENKENWKEKLKEYRKRIEKMKE